MRGTQIWKFTEQVAVRTDPVGSHPSVGEKSKKVILSIVGKRSAIVGI